MPVPYEIAEVIREKKARYCRCLDTKKWNELEELALPDASLIFYDVNGEVLRTGGVIYRFESPAAFVKTMAAVFRHARTSHHVMNSELSLVAENRILAVWAMTDYIVFPSIAGIFPLRFFGHGHYHEIWEERDGDWFL
jgi:hypothetical protein